MTTAGWTRRRALLAAAAAGWALPRGTDAAGAGPDRTYAVLSLVGDEFSVVTRRQGTGSSLDLNRSRALAVDGAVLDGAASTAAEQAIEAASPAAGRLRFSIRDARLFALQDRLLAATSGPLRDELAAMLVDAKVTHLLLLTKATDDARFPLADGSVGGGRIRGIGFYIDNLTSTRDIRSGVVSEGYVSAYACVTASLLEVSGWRVLASRQSRESVMSTPSDAAGAVIAWQATSAEDKAAQLDRVVGRAAFAATRDALGAP